MLGARAILEFFETADLTAANLMLELSQGAVEQRNQQAVAKPERKPRPGGKRAALSQEARDKISAAQKARWQTKQQPETVAAAS